MKSVYLMHGKLRLQLNDGSHQQGLTLVEVMVTIAIVAIIGAVAMPSFKNMIEGWRVRQAAGSLEHSIYYARSEAIRRGGDVSMENNGSWQQGWKICADGCSNGAILRELSFPDNVVITRNGGGSSIAFSRWGTVHGTWPSFNIHAKNGSSSDPTARKLVMSSGGRIHISRN